MEPDGKRPLTRFGATLLKLMITHGIRETTQLSQLLEDAGYEYKKNRISSWLYGKNQADEGFPKVFAEVLALSEEEKMELAMSFTFGQREYLLPERAPSKK